jgi:hypothetical protein
LQDSVYYPASGLDGDPIRYLGGYSHSFVYADFAVPVEKISASINNPQHALKGYRLLFSKDVSETAFPEGWHPIADVPKSTKKGDVRARKQPLGYALWSIFERRQDFGPDHGPNRLSLLFVGGEALAVYEALYVRNKVAPKVVAIIHCGIGWGFVCTELANPDGAFAQAVLGSSTTQPQFVLHGVRSGSCKDCCWKGFKTRVTAWRLNDGKLALWQRS